MQFNIQSFVLKPDVKEIKPNDPNLSTYFIPIHEIQNIKDKKNGNPKEIEGYIRISDNQNNILMDEKYWDTLTVLWAYILNLVEECLENNTSEIYFPDQPIQMSLKFLSHESLEFSIEDQKWILPKTSFLNALLNASEDYFIKLGTYFSTGVFVDQIAKIKKLKKTTEHRTE